MIGPSFPGGTSLLVPCGVWLCYLEMEKAIRQTTEHALVTSLACQMEEVTAGVVLLSDTTADVHARGCYQGQSTPSASAVEAVASRTTARPGYRSKVRFRLNPCQSFSTFQPGDTLPDRTPWR